MEIESSKRENFEIGDETLKEINQKRSRGDIKTRFNFRDRRHKIYAISLAIIITIIVSIIIYVIAKKYFPFGENSDLKNFPVLIAEMEGYYCKLRIIKFIISNESSSSTEYEELFMAGVTPEKFNDLSSMLDYSLNQFRKTEIYPKTAIISAPNVENGVIKENPFVPNWSPISTKEIEKKLNFDKVVFLSTIDSYSYGIQANLEEDYDYIKLNDKKIDNDGKKFIVLNDYNFNMNYLIKSSSNNQYEIKKSDANLYEFEPLTDNQINYKKFLKDFYKIENVEAEKVCSLNSLIPIYKFLRNELEDWVDCDKVLENKIKEIYDISQIKMETLDEINQEIIEKGMDGTCELSKVVLQFSVELLANIVSKTIINETPTGGIYIAGDFPSKIRRKFIDDDLFISSLIQRIVKKEIIENIPVFMIISEKVPIKGNIEYAKRILFK